MSERYKPQSWVREAGDPVPTCLDCHGLLRRRVFKRRGHGDIVHWDCDLHGHVDPVWVDPRRGDDE